MNLVYTQDDIDKGLRPLGHEFCNSVGFTSDKFDGYLWIMNDLVIISLIVSLYPNKGNFKNLINNIKSKGYSIVVPHCSNIMYNILRRYNFTGTPKEMKSN